MDPTYSVIADWLSKFHTWPESIQALWIVALTLIALALIAGVTRVLTAVVGVFAGSQPHGGFDAPPPPLWPIKLGSPATMGKMPEQLLPPILSLSRRKVQ